MEDLGNDLLKEARSQSRPNSPNRAVESASRESSGEQQQDEVHIELLNTPQTPADTQAGSEAGPSFSTPAKRPPSPVSTPTFAKKTKTDRPDTPTDVILSQGVAPRHEGAPPSQDSRLPRDEDRFPDLSDIAVPDGHSQRNVRILRLELAARSILATIENEAELSSNPIFASGCKAFDMFCNKEFPMKHSKIVQKVARLAKMDSIDCKQQWRLIYLRVYELQTYLFKEKLENEFKIRESIIKQQKKIIDRYNECLHARNILTHIKERD
jgi:hypothetical protein